MPDRSDRRGAAPPRSPPVEPRIGEVGDPFRAGFVALVGRPNVGKSTLLNRVLGQKLAPATHKPQTTRRNLLGVLNPPDAQICLLDTPGHHQAKGPLNRFMVAQAEQALAEADVVSWVVEARPHGELSPGNGRILGVLQSIGKPVVVAVNKDDTIKNKKDLLPQLAAYSEVLGAQCRAVVPISARRGKGLEAWVRELGRALPEGDPHFDLETLTNASERELAAELIREKLMLEVHQELPYVATVTIEAWDDKRPRVVVIHAMIHVEKQAQKGIVIGKGGERLRSIGTRARGDLEGLLQSSVFLDLQVKVSRDWTTNRERLDALGYGPHGGSGGAEIDMGELVRLLGEAEGS